MRKMKDSGVLWIGEIPAEWSTMKIKFSSWLKGRIGWDGLKSTEFIEKGPYLITGTDFKNGEINWETCVHISEERYAEDELLHIRENDLLITKDGTIGKLAIAKNCPEKVSLNSGVMIIRNTGKFNYCDKYLYYILQSDEFYLWYELSQNGNSTIKHLYQGQFYNFEYSFPKIEEQQKIAAYLDTQCSKVDTLIANQQSQIEKLKSYKQSLITEVVTKGLDKNVPMKDSGVEWIGEIPKHWNLSRIKNLFSLRNERNEEADLNKVNLISLYTDLGVVQHSDITETTGNKAVTAEGYKLVHKNDIVVNIILCWMGAVGKSNYNGVTSPAYDIYKPNINTNSDYYHYLFRTKRFNGECYRYGRGIMMMRWRTYSTEFSSIYIPVPSEDEQKQIVRYLDNKCSQIDSLISLKQQKIEKLQQYKKSLIYEYVTGKKEVE